MTHFGGTVTTGAQTRVVGYTPPHVPGKEGEMEFQEQGEQHREGPSMHPGIP